MSSSKMKIGISACVIGQKVRFDASNKPSQYCINELSQYVDYKPICPEVAVGLPVPRKTIRQIETNDIIKVSQPNGDTDVTDALKQFGKDVASDMDDLSGYIFCAKSPTCGMERVKVYYDHQKGCRHDGVGIYAAEIMKAHPNLPVEENGRLNDPHLRENFVNRIFAYSRWKDLVANGIDSKHQIIEFHAKHKYMLMSHKPAVYKSLGTYLGTSKDSLDVIAENYISHFMYGLKHHATRKQHANTLFHLQGYFKRQLDKVQKATLANCIEEYRKGLVPLLVPMTLIQSYLAMFPNEYLRKQKYLNPYPKELRLRYGI